MKLKVTHLVENNLYAAKSTFIDHTVKYITVTHSDGKECTTTPEILRNSGHSFTFPMDSTIKLVKEKNVPVLRKDSVTGETMELSEWQKKISELTTSVDEDGCFEDIDQEYEHKKFTKKWNAFIYEQVEEVVNVEIEVSKVIQFDTKNPHIEAHFSFDDDREKAMYTYHRQSAILIMVNDFFKERGFQFQANAQYEATKNKKIYGYSNTGLRYLVAFGTFVFSGDGEKLVSVPNTYQGTLEACTLRYNSDIEDITKYLTDYYNRHFGAHININKLSLCKVLYELKSIKNRVETLEVKKTSCSDKRITTKTLNELIDLCQNQLNSEMDNEKDNS